MVPSALKSLFCDRLQLTTPTKVQLKAWPLLLEKKNAIVVAVRFETLSFRFLTNFKRVHINTTADRKWKNTYVSSTYNSEQEGCENK